MREALAVPDCVREVFATRDALSRHHDIREALDAASIDARVADERAVAALAGSVTPQGLVAVCRFVDVPLEQALASVSVAERALVAVGAGLRDPGNAGTLVRCADAVGADAVVLAGSSVDAYNDKTVRASAGSLFHVPLVAGPAVATVVGALHGAGCVVLAADGRAESTLDDLADDPVLSGRVAWVFGNEARGIADDDLARCDRSVAVPLYGRAESLNVAAAAAVCLYATARAQRAAR